MLEQFRPQFPAFLNKLDLETLTRCDGRLTTAGRGTWAVHMATMTCGLRA